MGKKVAEEKTAKEIIQWFKDTKGKAGQLSLGTVPGFHLKRNKNDASFRLKYTLPGANKPSFEKIGPYPKMTLNTARTKAEELHQKILSGFDPKKDREAQIAAAANTVSLFFSQVYKPQREPYLDAWSDVERAITKHFAMFANTTMQTLTKQDLVRWQTSMLTNNDPSIGRGSPLSPTTIKTSYAYFKKMLNTAVEYNYLEFNPLQGVSLEAMTIPTDAINATREKRKPFTKEQVHQFFNGIKSYKEEKIAERNNSREHGKKHLTDLSKLSFVDHVEPMLLLLFYTGLRPGDVHSLEWQHVEFENKSIFKVLNKTRKKNPVPTKIPLNDSALEMLQQWHAQNKKPSKGLVFPSPITGKQFSATALNKPWIKIKEAGGLPQQLDIYVLRHNFASTLVAEGINLFTVAKLMGHSTTKMIEKHYGHLAPDQAHDAVNLLNGPA